MAMTLELVPAHTRVTSSGDGQAFDISSSSTRTFLITLTIYEQIEQESIDLSIWGSADGTDFGTKPLLKLPQRFYCGDVRLVLDLTLRPEIKFVRARWDLNRWGRVAPEPMFVIGVQAAEIPAFPKRNSSEKLATSVK
jgi:hypothetical protein